MAELQRVHAYASLLMLYGISASGHKRLGLLDIFFQEIRSSVLPERLHVFKESRGYCFNIIHVLSSRVHREFNIVDQLPLELVLGVGCAYIATSKNVLLECRTERYYLLANARNRDVIDAER